MQLIVLFLQSHPFQLLQVGLAFLLFGNPFLKAWPREGRRGLHDQWPQSQSLLLKKSGCHFINAEQLSWQNPPGPQRMLPRRPWSGAVWGQERPLAVGGLSRRHNMGPRGGREARYQDCAHAILSAACAQVSIMKHNET